MTSTFGCSYDQSTSEYNTFKEAFEDDFFRKGWIPKELQFKSMKNIYNKNNLDSNNSIFSFELSKMDLEELINKLEESSLDYIDIHDITEPTNWIEEISKLNKYKSNLFKQNIAIDIVNHKVYGWIDE